MGSDGPARRGYIVLGDISGYTQFITTTELAHAQSIIGELTELIIDTLAPPLHFVKAEGDAVLCHAAETVFPGAERLLELFEVCYLQFANRRAAMSASTTCTCAACSSIGNLDLKFISHHGEFLAHSVRGAADIAGSDVVLAHRLLKNDVPAALGTRAYVLFSAACRERLPADLSLVPHEVDCESIGRVPAGVYDLRPVLQGQRQGEPARITRDQADFVFATRLPAPPAVVWHYFAEAGQRLRWQGGLKAMEHSLNERARVGVGATGHCDHGSWSADHRYVDWRPFEYFTTVDTPVKESFFGLPAGTTTHEFHAAEGGTTQYRYLTRLEDRGLPSRLVMRAFTPLVRKILEDDAKRLRALLAEDGVTTIGA